MSATRDRWMNKAWDRLMADERLALTRRKLSAHEIRMILAITVGPCADALHDVETFARSLERGCDGGTRTH